MAGIMAVAGFVARLFGDIALMLCEFGQWFVGVLVDVFSRVAGIFRNQILYWQSWVWAKETEFMLVAIREILLRVIPQDVPVRIRTDMPLHIVASIAGLGIQIDAEFCAYIDRHNVWFIGAELYCLVSHTRIHSDAGEILVDAVTMMWIPVEFWNITRSRTHLRAAMPPEGEGTYHERGNISRGYNLTKNSGITTGIFLTIVAQFAAINAIYAASIKGKITGWVALGAFLYSVLGALGPVPLSFSWTTIMIVDSLIKPYVVWRYVNVLNVTSRIFRLAFGALLASIALLWFMCLFKKSFEIAMFVVGVALAAWGLGNVAEEWNIFMTFLGAFIDTYGACCLYLSEVEEMGYGLLATVTAVFLALALLQCSGHYELLASDLAGTVDLEPPQVCPSSWGFDRTTKQLTFRVDIAEVGDRTYSVDGKTVSSHIMDFGIIVVEKNPKGDPGVPVDPRDRDPLSGKNYRFTISFNKLIGTNATIIEEKQWRGENKENKNWDVFEGTYSLVLTDNKDAYVEGTIKFDDWAPGTYYVIVWAVDEWGNARWVCYEVSDDPPTRMLREPESQNERGMTLDPEGDMKYYYYTFRGEVYVPYTWSGLGYDKGLAFVLPHDAEVRIGTVVIESPNTTWGYFTYRVDELFEYRRMNVGGNTVCMFIEHTYDGFYVEFILPLSALFALFLVLHRRKRG